MLNIKEDDLITAIVAKATDELLGENDLSAVIAKEVKARIDVIFKDRAEAQIAAAIDEAIRSGFEREYQRVTQWGEPSGPKTSIRAELEKLVNGYWNQSVEPKTGKPTDNSYSKITRAEWLMTTICAQDFSEAMKASAISITGALKDGLRNQMGAQMDRMLEELFRVKSLQDQGKVEKPY